MGITANENRCRYLVENSVGIITAICPYVGYQKAADIAKKAIRTGDSVRKLILEEGIMTEEELDKVLDPVSMTEPGIIGKGAVKKYKRVDLKNKFRYTNYQTADVFGGGSAGLEPPAAARRKVQGRIFARYARRATDVLARAGIRRATDSERLCRELPVVSRG